MIRLLPIIALLALTACETIEGAGRDISGGARAVKNAF
ncbi:MAG: entericidin, EcnA/B family [Litoreibacter sp.]|nr:entericidin, EcnA/B family [Litoreibacter sp.]